MCVLTFRGDLEFWGLKDTLMESCCRDKYEADLLHVLQVRLFLFFFASHISNIRKLKPTFVGVKKKVTFIIKTF